MTTADHLRSQRLVEKATEKPGAQKPVFSRCIETINPRAQPSQEKTGFLNREGKLSQHLAGSRGLKAARRGEDLGAGEPGRGGGRGRARRRRSPVGTEAESGRGGGRSAGAKEVESGRVAAGVQRAP